MNSQQSSLLGTNRLVPSSGASLTSRSIPHILGVLEQSSIHANVSSRPATRSLAFFQLPSEIRLAIYHAVLVDNNDTIAILQACRQMSTEAREMLYHRTPTFDCQSKFFTWISKSSVRNLNRVRTITVRLTDVDLESLLDESSSKRRTRTTIWSLYRNDSHKLEQSLSALPNLSRLTIIPPELGHSLLLKDMYHSFLAEIPRRCLRLKELEISDSDSILEIVPALKEIRQVLFTDPDTSAMMKSRCNRKEPRRAAGMAGETMAKRSRPPDAMISRQSARKRTLRNLTGPLARA